MYEKLKYLQLPSDTLVEELWPAARGKARPASCACRKGDFDPITVSLVSDPRLVEAARRYITRLVEEKEKYGYLYFLAEKKLMIPLEVQFKSDGVFIQQSEREPVLQALKDLAAQFFHPGHQRRTYDITLVELLYFFARVANPSLSWLAVNSILHCVQYHVHLLMSPHRPHSWMERKIKS